MTTIVACRSTLSVACDSRVTTYDFKAETERYATRCYKLWRTRKYIIGAAGNDDDIEYFKRWLHDTSKKRRWGGKDGFAALMLSRTRLFYVDDDSGLNEVQDDYYAIGTGAEFALASMNTSQRLTGTIDVELAVLVAIDHDTKSGPPVLVERWAPIKRRPKNTIAPAGASPINITPEALDGSTPVI